jgi:hypothetical protein
MVAPRAMMRGRHRVAQAGLLFLAAWSAGVSSPAAHILEPRKNLEGFLQRSEVIFRARVIEATRSEHPKAGVYPLVTVVEPLEVLRGGPLPSRVTLLGRDDHACRYREGEHVLLFGQGRVGPDARLVPDQLKGEEIYVRGDDEAAAWDTFIPEALKILRAEPSILASAPYRALLFQALRARSATLREHALRRVALWLSAPGATRGEIDTVLASVSDAALPERFRTAVARAAFRHLTASDWRGLVEGAKGGPVFRGGLLEAWCERVAGPSPASSDIGAAERAHAEATAQAWFAQSKDELRLYAAAALAKLGNLRSFELLDRELRSEDLRRKRIAIRGLARLARAGRVEARQSLTAAKEREREPRVRRWIDEALPPRAQPAGPAVGAGYPRAVWVAAFAGAGCVLVLAVWLVLWRRRKRAPADAPRSPS